MKKQTTINKLKILLLVCAVLVTMLGTAIPAYAAGGTITVKYDPQAEIQAENFTLYKVGGFTWDDNGKAILMLDPNYEWGNIEVNYPLPENPTDGDKAKQEKDYVDAASQVYDKVKSFNEKPSSTNAAWNKDTKTATFSVAENGLYLLVGDTQMVGNTKWTPVPVLIKVLNGNQEFTLTDTELKLKASPVTYDHEIYKTWSDEGHDKLRPEEIQVDILYGDGDKAFKVDTVTLKASNNQEDNWHYSWKSQIKESRNSNDKTLVYIPSSGEQQEFAIEKESVWAVSEVVKDDDNNVRKYYVVSSTSDTIPTAGTDTELTDRFTITNTFGMDELVINKTMSNYFQAAEGASTPVVFDIKGYIKENEVYHNQQGISFSGPGQDSLTISNLPLGLDKLEVKEIYSPNYTPDKATKVYTKEAGNTSDIKYEANGTGGKYTVSFTNTWNGGTDYNTGIVNKYQKNEDGSYTYQAVKPENQ